MRHLHRVYVLAILAIAIGCATGPAVMPAGVSLPPDITVTPPSSTIPREVAAFSGKWAGTWSGPRDFVLIVEKVSPVEAQIVYAQGTSPTSRVGAFSYRRSAPIENGVLTVRYQSGPVMTVVPNKDGTLQASITEPGGTFHATLRRIRE